LSILSRDYGVKILSFSCQKNIGKLYPAGVCKYYNKIIKQCLSQFSQKKAQKKTAVNFWAKLAKLTKIGGD
jgi:hypothetical protein